MNLVTVMFAVLLTTLLSSFAFAADPPLKLKLRNNAASPIADMEFVFVKGGCYKMGDFEFPSLQLDICVSDFYIGKYEVTQAQWEKVMGNNPSIFKECGADCPVEGISWNDSQEFIKKLNTMSGKQHRLPTDAEWQYAARSNGKNERWPGTNDERSLSEYAWIGSNSGEKTHRVGTKKPNSLGIHDMAGNVLEWCQDWYISPFDDYFRTCPKENPSGPNIGKEKVMRGGYYLGGQGASMFFADYSFKPDDRLGGITGVRLVYPAK